MGRRASRALAALLWSDRPILADRLGDIVWGDEQPADARESLHVLVWRLRRLIEPDRARGDPPTLLVLSSAGYMLLVRTKQLDSRRFTELVGDARAAADNDDAAGALERVEEALGLWRGHPLGDLGHEPWAVPMAGTLLETRASALELRLDALSRVGRDEEVAAETEQLVAEHPTREGMWARRARAQYRTGDQSSGLRTLHAARSYLAEELGVQPGPELTELESQILHHDPALTVAAALPCATGGGGRSPAKRRLPRPRSSYVGRDDETARLSRLVVGERRVTVTGAGGVGKTRLAVEVANTVASAFADGAVFVDLTRANSDDDVASVTAAALGLGQVAEPIEALLVRLAEQQLLIVFDGCERVVRGTAALVDELEVLDGVPVLATSRCPLGADAERIVGLDPLAVPKGTARATTIRRNHAVRLLVDRAEAAGAVMGEDSATLAGLGMLAAHLDGLPLAIELAAFALGTLGLDACLVLANECDLPAAPGACRPDHHRTLDAAVAWSFDACDPRTRRLLERLAAIPGWFQLELAEHVGAGQPVAARDIAGCLAGLVHNSLVATRLAGDCRQYRMLRYIRSYVQRAAGPAVLAAAQDRLANPVGEPGGRPRRAGGREPVAV